MAFVGDFTPASPNAVEGYSIDFALQIAAGDSIVSVSAALPVHYGTDAAASARLSGSPTFSGTVVTQTLSALQPGVAYNLILTAITTLGATLPNYGRVSCAPIA